MTFNTEENFPALMRLARWFGHLRWIPRGQDKLLRIMFNPNLNTFFPFEVDFFGLKYRGNTNSFLDWWVLFYGTYERHVLDVLEKASRCLRADGRPVIYIDVGVNIGQHFLFMTRLADRCYGFEPFEDALKQALEKIEINGITNAKLYQIALGERNETRTFFTPSSVNKGVGSFIENWSPDLRCQGVPVEVRTGSEFLEKEEMRNIGLVKIDVEGFEGSVCRGLSEIFKRDRPFIVLELSPNGAREFGSESTFKSCFYEDAAFYRLDADLLKPYQFGERLVELVIVPNELRLIFERTRGAQD